MAMKPINTILAGVMALATLCGQQAMADRYSDYWAPQNMAKRQCTSVHIGYQPSVPEHTAAYNEAVIEKSAPGTYFALNNFSCGYIGVQELGHKDANGRPVRVAIFSIWDAKDTGDNPHAAPEEERAKLVQKGRLVTTRRFGGEGTGGNSMRPFAWREGEVIRTLVVEKEDGKDFRQIAGYIWDPETKQWELLSCWRIQALSRGLGGGCGFVEDFKRDVDSKRHERRATFGPAWRWTGKEWSQAMQYRFTRDANPNNEINCRYNSGRGYFSLATGGNIKPEVDFAPFDTKELNTRSAAPGADVMKFINAPKLEEKK